MPYKNKINQNEYMKLKMRNKRQTEYNKRSYDQVIRELKLKSILPRHIYEFRKILNQMLKQYFKKRIIKINNKTELITQSHNWV